MSRSPREYLKHILDEIHYVRQACAGLDKEAFLHDETLKRSFVRSLEIIGEAGKKVSDDMKVNHAEIEWRKISSMRDRLIHGYFGVDYDIVWDVIIHKLPEIERQIKVMLDELETE